jgi:hypothetical protein
MPAVIPRSGAPGFVLSWILNVSHHARRDASRQLPWVDQLDSSFPEIAGIASCQRRANRAAYSRDLRVGYTDPASAPFAVGGDHQE